MSNRHTIGIIFGPNGAGKGTLAEKLSEELDCGYLNMGNLIREWMHRHQDDKEVRKRINNGDLVDDELVKKILLAKFSRPENHKRYIFDGFPRRKSQIFILKEICETYNFEVRWIISLNISLEDVLERITGRVMTPDGHVYHLKYNPPPKHINPELLKRRRDDRPVIVEKRYTEYSINTLECLSDTFFKDVLVGNIDASKSIEEVHDDAKQFITHYSDLIK